MLTSCAEPCPVGEALRRAAARLRPVADNPALEAEVLLAHLLGRDRTFLWAHPEAPLTPEQVARYTAWVERRAAHEPLPYITGRVEFFGLTLAVTPAVLIPRPETETLVEVALAWARRHPHALAVDVGTGSGCIAVALAVHVPTLHLIATDISAAALHLARRNAQAHHVDGRVRFIQGDMLTPVRRAALIVSNPPYVAAGEWEALPPSVKREPRLALWGGDDGLTPLRRLLRQARHRLSPGGLLLVEIGAGQGESARALARAHFPHAHLDILPDLAGHDRVLAVRC